MPCFHPVRGILKQDFLAFHFRIIGPHQRGRIEIERIGTGQAPQLDNPVDLKRYFIGISFKPLYGGWAENTGSTIRARWSAMKIF